MKVFDQAGWREARAKGKAAFLLRYGFLGRGIPLGVGVAVFIELFLGGGFPQSLSSPDFWQRLALFVAVFTATGCLNASLSWNLHEKRFPS